jgi:hemerythrin-like domain-containing protein
MVRDKNLIPLSHQHHHALSLCVRIDRALQGGDVELEPWLMEVEQLYKQEITVHFAAEEKEVFPAAQNFTKLRPIVQRLILEHAELRELFVKAATRAMTAQELKTCGERLSAHIRKEERQLFEGMQNAMTPEQLKVIGTALEKALAEIPQECLIPNVKTRLRAATKSDNSLP